MNRLNQPALAEGLQDNPTVSAPAEPWISTEEAVGLTATLLGGIAAVTGIGRELASKAIASAQAPEGQHQHLHAANELAAHALQFGGGVALVVGLGLYVDSRRRNQ